MAKDMQKKKLYAAENMWIETAKAQGWRRVFIAFEHMEAYAETVYRGARDNREALGITGGVVRPRLEKRMRGRRSTGSTTGRVRIASGKRVKDFNWIDHLILHELAHVWSNHTHDRAYAALYLKLVERWMGKEPAEELRRHFRDFNVKFTPKRVLSAARKQELSQRMTTMRSGGRMAERAVILAHDPQGELV